MKYCYIRISTNKQEYDRQIEYFKRLGYIDGVNCKYVLETKTGTKINRSVFTKLIDKMQVDDTIIVEKLERLSRGGVIKTLELISYLILEKKINVIVIKENFNLKGGKKPDAITNLFLGIFSALAQFERDLLSERTKEGLIAVKNKGVKLGKPRGKRSTKENFINVLEYMIQNNSGQLKSTKICNYPHDTFKCDIKKLYQKYNTKDYKKILFKLKVDDSLWF